MFTIDIQIGATVRKQWTFYILTVMTENNVNNKYAFSIYLVLISVTTETLLTNTGTGNREMLYKWVYKCSLFCFVI